MNPDIKEKLDSYPASALTEIVRIRRLIYEVAKNDHLGEITESLKWGELSYLTKQGSPIRIDWKPPSPHTISIYFNCKTRLVETFREIYPETFEFKGNRELILVMSESLPEKELKHCLSMALQYHRLKHLPLLGA